MGHSINASCVQKSLCMRKICASIFNLILVPKPSSDLVNGAESKFIGIRLYDSDPKSVKLTQFKKHASNKVKTYIKMGLIKKSCRICD